MPSHVMSPTKSPGISWRSPRKLMLSHGQQRRRSSKLFDSFKSSGTKNSLLRSASRRCSAATSNVGSNPFQASPTKFHKATKRYGKNAKNRKSNGSEEDSGVVACDVSSFAIFDAAEHLGESLSQADLPTDFSSMLSETDCLENKNTGCDDAVKASDLEDFETGTTFAAAPLNFTLSSRMQIVLKGMRCVDDQPRRLVLPTVSHLAQGSSNFVNESKRQQNLVDTDPVSLASVCMSYVYPLIPGVACFPRLRYNTYMQKNHNLPDEVKQAIMEKWQDCFLELCDALENNRCDYFFLCADPFTVLAISSGFMGLQRPVWLFSPTSTGFRKRLVDEGLTFSMPLKTSESTPKFFRNNSETFIAEPSCSSSSGLASSMEDDFFSHTMPERLSTENEESDFCPDNFCETVNLSPGFARRFKKRIKREVRDSFQAESTIMIQDTEGKCSNAKLLIDLMCDSSVWMTQNGPSAGLPPTLISPSPFCGAALQSATISAGTVTMGNTKYPSLNLSGFLLPCQVQRLAELLALHCEAFRISWLHNDYYRYFGPCLQGKAASVLQTPCTELEFKSGKFSVTKRN